ncbi:hypothetical protein [Nocardia jiangxiensis]|uniref:hypothetical protein n=1 Tax=Nocardia jiangxiensis TaxID=282685 RepID=UPI0002FADBF5|nr:hypothetical protein [Nocardia jiangxiensis]
MDFDLSKMTLDQLHALHDIAESMNDEPKRRKIGKRIDLLNDFKCEYTFSHTRDWCMRLGCRKG